MSYKAGNSGWNIGAFIGQVGVTVMHTQAASGLLHWHYLATNPTLGDCCCHLIDFGSCSCWFRPRGVVQDVCGNVGCYSIGASTGGLGYPRVTRVRSARHRLRQPIINSVSRSISLPTGVLYYSRFCGSRLWNRSVFSVYVQSDNLSAGRDQLRNRLCVRDPRIHWRPDCRWSP